MASTALRRVFMLCLAVVIGTASSLAQDSKALAGKWNMTSETQQDPVNWTLLLKETDGKLTASVLTDGDETPAKDFSYTDGVLRFRVPYQGQDYDIMLRLDGAKLTGKWSGAEDSGVTSGTKSS